VEFGKRFRMRGASMKRTMIFVYGLACYAIFFGTFCYAVGFLGNLVVPKSIDSPAAVSIGEAMAVDMALLGLFALQHSVMARRGFKRWLTRFVPTPAERSTYVLASSLALILLFWQWRPIGGIVWEIDSPLLRAGLNALYAAGWLAVLWATVLISHFDLFGLRQVWLHLRRREPTPLEFVTPGPYRIIRHPLYVGWITVFWSAPTMTAAHLLFAVATTVYILVAIRFEERDLLEAHGRAYAEYRRRVPMLIPSLSGRRGKRGEAGNLSPSAGA
jgi:methanethiol S-methyltransferase